MMIQLQGLLSTITFLDVIDIVVVAYFLYRLFLMLKNTRAATLGKGLMVLIGFTLICRWLNLHVISWLLEKSMTVIMVALPVVFPVPPAGLQRSKASQAPPESAPH